MSWYYEMFDWLGEDYFLVLNKEQIRKAKKEVAFLLEHVELQSGQEVLDLCCGIGRHAIALAQKDCRVVGLDHSIKLLAKAEADAKQHNQQIQWVQGDMRRLPFREHQFDVVINLWTSFGYLETDEEHLQVLKEVSRVLKPDGTFILDIPNRDWVIRNLEVGQEVRELAGIVEINTYDFDTRSGRDLITTRYINQGEEREFKHSCRMFTYGEIAEMLKGVGLRPVRSFGGFDGRSLHWDNKQIIVLAKKD